MLCLEQAYKPYNSYTGRSQTSCYAKNRQQQDRVHLFNVKSSRVVIPTYIFRLSCQAEFIFVGMVSCWLFSFSLSSWFNCTIVMKEWLQGCHFGTSLLLNINFSLASHIGWKWQPWSESSSSSRRYFFLFLGCFELSIKPGRKRVSATTPSEQRSSLNFS